MSLQFLVAFGDPGRYEALVPVDDPVTLNQSTCRYYFTIDYSREPH